MKALRAKLGRVRLVLVSPITQFLGRGVSDGLILSNFLDLTVEMLVAVKT